MIRARELPAFVHVTKLLGFAVVRTRDGRSFAHGARSGDPRDHSIVM